MNDRPAQVSVNQNDFLTGLGHDGRQVGGGRTFAFARIGACHQEGTNRLVQAGELDIGAQNAVRLRDGRFRINEGHQLAVRVGIRVILARARNRAQGRELERIDNIVRVLEGVIQVFDQQNAAGCQHHADQQAKQRVQEDARPNRFLGHFSRFDDGDCVRGAGFVQAQVFEALDQICITVAILLKAVAESRKIGLLRARAVLDGLQFGDFCLHLRDVRGKGANFLVQAFA